MSEDIWFYAKSGQQIGPMPRAQLEQLVMSGQVTPGDFVWTKGMPKWEPAGEVFAAYITQPPPAPMGSAAIGYYAPTYDSPARYAGFWVRFVAWFIDWIIMVVGCAVLCGCVAGIIGGVLGVKGTDKAAIDRRVESLTPIFQVIGFLISWLYYAFMESSSRQATFGKSIMGLVVMDMNGQRLSFGRASGRFFGKIISGLIICIGYVMISFTQRKQALHDIMAGTVVMKRTA